MGIGLGDDLEGVALALEKRGDEVGEGRLVVDMQDSHVLIGPEAALASGRLELDRFYPRGHLITVRTLPILHYRPKNLVK